MSKYEVAAWLHNVGMGQYAESFIENDIDGAVLSRLNLEQLKADLDIRSLGARMKLISLIPEFPQVVLKAREALEAGLATGHAVAAPVVANTAASPRAMEMEGCPWSVSGASSVHDACWETGVTVAAPVTVHAGVTVAAPVGVTDEDAKAVYIARCRENVKKLKDGTDCFLWPVDGYVNTLNIDLDKILRAEKLGDVSWHDIPKHRWQQLSEDEQEKLKADV